MRGPFQGTYVPNQRPVISTSPDAVVRLNGDTTLQACSKCSKRFDFNKYVTSVQTNASVDGQGTATIALSIPRHTVDDFFLDGKPIVTPMMEVEIYAKGYYLVEGLPQYYPIFWGLVTGVDDSYSGGEHTVSIQCQDILHWWQISQVTVNPAFLAPTGARGRSIFGNVLHAMNPYDAIFTLAYQAFGDIVVGTGTANALVRESVDASLFKTALADIMLYWEKRFAKMRSKLVLYGTRGIALRGETLFAKYSTATVHSSDTTEATQPIIATAIAEANGGGATDYTFNPYSGLITAFRNNIQGIGSIDLWQSEHQTKLELANAAKEVIGYEFYMDVNGDLVFKPPFYNVDTYGNKPTSWIQDIDIISWDFGESDAEVVTQITMQGKASSLNDYGLAADLNPYTAVVDYHLLQKYGWRTHPYNSEFITDTQSAFVYGLDLLDRLNSRRHSGSVTIPMRPELRLGFPMYVAPKDEMWYLTGIAHNLSFGGQATTSLTLTAKRSKFVAPRGMGRLTVTSVSPDASAGEATKQDGASQSNSSALTNLAHLTLDVGNAKTLPATEAQYDNAGSKDDPSTPLVLRHPRTGKIMGYPNVVMAYTRPFEPQVTEAQKISGDTFRGNDSFKDLQAQQQMAQEAVARVAQEKFSRTPADALTDRYLSNRYQYGMTSAGVYIYAHDTTKAITDVLLIPGANLKVNPKEFALSTIGPSQTAYIRPVSDERGFEVIGHFAYGRNVALRDGRLIISEKNTSRASVTAQTALSGGMAEMLTAQSQGLVTVAAKNPVAALSSMTPDDKQSAAALDNGKVRYTSTGDNFVSTETLGSMEEQGSSSAEASQLSRALTLAEMTVREPMTYPDENCVCLMGRADLAFMNKAFLDPPLTGTATEDGTSVATNAGQAVGTTPDASASLERMQKRLEQAEAELVAAAQRVKNAGRNTNQQDAAVQDFLRAQLDVGNARQGVQIAQDAKDEKDRERAATASMFTLSPSELISRVDSYLTQLYVTLDDAHQQYEKAIRGELIPVPDVTAEEQAGVTSDLGDSAGGLPFSALNPDSDFAPPFSAPQRFTLGDPRAAAGAAETEAQDIAKTFKSFGRELKAQSEQKKLTSDIALDNQSIARLEKVKADLEAQKAASDGRPKSTVVVPGNLGSQIDTVQKQIDRLRQRISDNELRLQSNG